MPLSRLNKLFHRKVASGLKKTCHSTTTWQGLRDDLFILDSELKHFIIKILQKNQMEHNTERH